MSDTKTQSTTSSLFTGTTGNDVLTGTGSFEVFYGGGGSDVFTAAGLKDVFIIDSLNKRVEITNFNTAHDTLYIGSSTGATSLQSLLANAHVTSHGALEINTGSGTSIVLDGITSAASLTASNVHFFNGTYGGTSGGDTKPTTPITPTTPTAPTTSPTPSPVFFRGTAGNDTLTGKGDYETFYGAGGSDVFTAAGKKDVFIIDSLNKRVEITNFNASHDMLYIGSSTGATSLESLLAKAHVTSNGALEITTSSGTAIVLDGITATAPLTANNVKFFSGNYGTSGTDSSGTSGATALPQAVAAHGKNGVNGWLPASSLYAGKAPDGATITQVKFTDVGKGGSYLDFNGKVVDNDSITLSPTDVANLHLNSGTEPGNYSFQVSVEDSNGHWSNVATGQLTVIGQPPHVG